MIEPVYYNEIDEYAAKWLQHLINAGLIAAGIVDTRSIEDVTPNDLIGFKQCHFFAGIGGWSLALRRAGWADSRSVWTASCPCQPFSAAGAGGGFADERHLWPCLDHLIAQRRPAVIFGEQVASGLVGPWIDLVHADLEAMGYAFGCIPFPSAGVGAPHIRDRNYWVAYAASYGQLGRRASGPSNGRDAARVEPERFCDAGRVADSHAGQWRGQSNDQLQPNRTPSRRIESNGKLESDCFADWMGDANSNGTGRDGRTVCDTIRRDERQSSPDNVIASGAVDRLGVAPGVGRERIGAEPEHRQSGQASEGADRPGPINGFWRAADWLGCTDGKWRPVEPGTFPLAHGVSRAVGRVRAEEEPQAALQGSRTGRLKGYGNAINVEAAAAFIIAASC